MMEIAIPVRMGKVYDHLINCDYFLIVSIDDGKITNEVKYEIPVEYRHDLKIALILAEKNVRIVLAGNMGYNEIDALYLHKIDALCYCTGDTNEAISMYLKGELSSLEKKFYDVEER